MHSSAIKAIVSNERSGKTRNASTQQYFLQEMGSLVCMPPNEVLRKTRNACMRQYCVQEWCAYQPIQNSGMREMHRVGQQDSLLVFLFFDKANSEVTISSSIIDVVVVW